MLKTVDASSEQLSSRDVIVLPNDKIITAAGNRPVKLWDENWNLLSILDECTDRKVTALQDGRFIVRGKSNDMKLWDGDGNLIRTLEGHQYKVDGVVELSDGNLLSWDSGLFQSNFILWNRMGWPDRRFTIQSTVRTSPKELRNRSIIVPAYTEFHVISRDGETIGCTKGFSELGDVIELSDGTLVSFDNKSDVIRVSDTTGRLLKTCRRERYHLETSDGQAFEFLGSLTAFKLHDDRILLRAPVDLGICQLWERDSENAFILEGRLEQALEILPEFREQYFGSRCCKNLVLRSPILHMQGRNMYLHDYSTGEKIFWECESICEPRILRQDGTAIVTRDHVVCFLQLYEGGHPCGLHDLNPERHT